MSDLTNEIVLRPRFRVSLKANLEQLESIFDNASANPFLVKRLDEHIFVKFKKVETTFWTPQLHLELSSFEEGVSNIRGVFGPNPTLWTFFMFLHFGVGTVFIILGIFAYSNYSLGKDITLWLVGMFFLVVIWFALYAFGRMGKSKGKGQMEQLKQFVRDTIAPFERINNDA
ncbi:MAG: GTP-binding protein [Bacteroidota bacterium]|uniref:GTP-binding protein n=1 Tax=Flagellimonas profundi TaxID=2915620 RepID=A0ABS3FIY0_9FLAO|nr:GTP-binding protein [Allomuricauda profundi]MBO0343062.1 GTP-binding protein [Allomuricauda profundi]MEC7770112.1 GTP-binding protein [Bacteroidota bacterium]